MKIELSGKECLIISQLLEQELDAIKNGIKNSKNKIITLKYPVIKIDEEEARKEARKIAPLFSVFYSAARYGK